MVAIVADSEYALGHNQLMQLPESMAACSELTRLNLRKNRIVSLPEAVGQWVQMRKLWLGYNAVWSSRLLDDCLHTM